MEGNSTPNHYHEPASMAEHGTHEAVFALVKEYLPTRGRVADLAAGEGAFSVRLKQLGHDVRAVDVSRDHWKVDDIPHSVADLDSEFGSTLVGDENKLDAVIAIEIIEHLENPFRFVRECAKLLKPGGLLFLTTPNVEAVNSRLIFLYTGRLNSFGAYETVRPAHITPIFKWKLDMMLDEARFELLEESFNRVVHGSSKTSKFKSKLTAVASVLLSPIVKGEKGGESRIIVARLMQ